MLTNEEIERESDWVLDRQLTIAEENLRVMNHRGQQETYEYKATLSYKGRIRAEIAKRHPYGFPPVLLV